MLGPGTVVAETYEITRLLGQGGMGAVWEAKHLRLPDKRVVVKVLLFGTTDAVTLARFRREAEIASRLGHPNIVQVLDFNTLPGRRAVHRPRASARGVAGGAAGAAATDLRQKRWRSSRRSARRWRRRTARGSSTAISSPTTSSSVPTPLDGEIRDVVKVLDFGISKIRGAKTVLTQDDALIGTPQYMAPEQATGRNDEIDARTDVFAFGAIVFEMLAGRPPFLGETLAAVIHAVVYEPTPPLRELAPETPPAVVAAVERALAKERNARFPDVGSFVKAVTARSLETAPTMAASPASKPAPAPQATERLPRQLPFPWKGAIVGVVLLAGGGLLATRILSAKPAAAPVAALPAAPAPPPPQTTEISPKSAAGVAPPPPVIAPPPPPERPRAAARSAAGKSEPLPPEVATELADAEAALDAGRGGDAIRLAQHSLYTQKSSRAYAIIARARCAQGNLGNAKASFAQVAARDRPAVKRLCGKLGVDLQ